ncbi:hypothetical protein UP09_07300 [Bradyrhizobium sp. LTSP885]|nr:hypothetical protein UP09_07300 [Bradyrhizobium sp. LTSP885]
MFGLTIGPSRAQCVDFSERAAKLDLDTFAKTPILLLESASNDKDKLKNRLAGYLVTNPDLLPPVRTLIAEATSDERSAIGAALRIAEMRCTTTKPSAARKLAAFAQRIDDLAVAKGYYTAGEDQSPQLAKPGDNKKAPAGDGLMSGQWRTEIADPFKPIPIPK